MTDCLWSRGPSATMGVTQQCHHISHNIDCYMTCRLQNFGSLLNYNVTVGWRPVWYSCRSLWVCIGYVLSICNVQHNAMKHTCWDVPNWEYHCTERLTRVIHVTWVQWAWAHGKKRPKPAQIHLQGSTATPNPHPTPAIGFVFNEASVKAIHRGMEAVKQSMFLLTQDLGHWVRGALATRC